MIEMLQSYEDSSTVGLLFRWRGMTISLVGMSNLDGEKFLSVNLDAAGIVELITDGTTATWSMSSEAADHSAAGAPIISAGDAPNVI